MGWEFFLQKHWKNLLRKVDEASSTFGLLRETFDLFWALLGPDLKRIELEAIVQFKAFQDGIGWKALEFLFTWTESDQIAHQNWNRTAAVQDLIGIGLLLRQQKLVTQSKRCTWMKHDTA